MKLMLLIPLLVLPLYVNGGSMIDTLYIVPIGPIQYDLLEEIASSLEKRFNISCKIDNRKFEIPPEAYDRKRDQYYSTIILKKLRNFPPLTAAALKLGVTEYDLYVPSLNFVFGEASPGSGIAIISLQRLREEFYGLDEDEDRLYTRMITEAVHELGHVYGLLHCSNPKCVMFFSNTIADTDRKSDKFCGNCSRTLEIGKEGIAN